MHAADAPPPAPNDNSHLPWYKEPTSYQWFVFIVASLGWLFDTMDQQLFALARMPALTELLHKTPGDPEIQFYAGIATMIFMFGWATGGLIFGVLGDRYGRARIMIITIILYSAFTGLSAVSQGPYDFMLYRFLTGLGVGGEFAVGVSLVAEVMPDRARPHALGLLQALSGLGNISAAFISMGLGQLEESGTIGSAWRTMFVVGVVPAVVAILVMRRLKEPERWKALAAARHGEQKPGSTTAADKGQQKLGSIGELFGDPRWRRHALLGMLLASSGIIGLWSVGFYSFELARLVFRTTFEERGLSPAEVNGHLTFWVGIVSLVFNIGAMLGIYFFSAFTHYFGRRAAFGMALVLALVSSVFTFLSLSSFFHVFVMIPIMGFCQLSMFGGYAIYFPELFPTRLRSTGTSFCYSVARYVSAFGPLALGILTKNVYGNYPIDVSFRYAGVTMCICYVIGLLVLPFLPETKGKPLPE
jgi:MFS family permease